MYNKNSKGPSTDPLGTPQVTSLTSEDSALRKTYCFLLLRFEPVQHISLMA